MLAADKLQLQSALKQQATALKEKEFNLHHSNLMTVGTQAAVLAGLDITMFIEFNPPHEGEWGEHVVVARAIKAAYYAVIVGAFGLNMLVVAHTTALSVLGASVALRGPDGSMMTATEGLYEERKAVFRAFGFGLALTILSVLFGVWLLLHVEAALVCWLVTLMICRKIYVNWKRVLRRFEYDEAETVDFSDILNMPALRSMLPSVGKASAAVNKRAPARRVQSDDIMYHHEDEDDSEQDLEMQPLAETVLSTKSGDVKRRTTPRR